MKPDPFFLCSRILDTTASISCLSDYYLEDIKDPSVRELADIHYDYCLDYGMGYIGPQWHFLHFGKHIMLITKESCETVRKALMEQNCRKILEHCLSFLLGTRENYDVPTRWQNRLRETILEMLVDGLHAKTDSIDEKSKRFTNTPLPDYELGFRDFMTIFDYHLVIDTLWDTRAVFGSTPLEVLDQFIYDMHCLWKRNLHNDFTYTLEERRLFY